MNGRTQSRLEAVIVTSEFFYVAAAFCFLMYFTYSKDEYSVQDYINSARKQLEPTAAELTSLDRSLRHSLQLNHLSQVEDISPEPNLPPPLSRSLSLQSVSLGEGVNGVFKRVMQTAISGIDGLRLSAKNSLTKDVDVIGEEAPLLNKN